jgi:hypothetical protein
MLRQRKFFVSQKAKNKLPLTLALQNKKANVYFLKVFLTSQSHRPLAVSVGRPKFNRQLDYDRH